MATDKNEIIGMGELSLALQVIQSTVEEILKHVKTLEASGNASNGNAGTGTPAIRGRQRFKIMGAPNRWSSGKGAFYFSRHVDTGAVGSLGIPDEMCGGIEIGQWQVLDVPVSSCKWEKSNNGEDRFVVFLDRRDKLTFINEDGEKTLENSGGNFAKDATDAPAKNKPAENPMNETFDDIPF